METSIDIDHLSRAEGQQVLGNSDDGLADIRRLSHLGMGVRPSAMSLSYLAFTGAVMSEAMMPGHIS